MAADRANERNARRDGLLRAARGPRPHRHRHYYYFAATAVEVVGYTGVPADSLASYGSHYEKPCLSPSFASSRFVLAARGTGSLALSRSRSRPTRSALATSSARFLPEGSTSTPLAPRRPVRFKSRVYSLGDVSSLIIKIHFYLRNKTVHTACDISK